MRMKHLFLAAVLGLALVQPVAAQSTQDAIATSNAVLDQMEAGAYEGVTGTFNAQMTQALGASQLEAVQKQMESAGPVTSRGEPRVSMKDGYTVVVTRIQRQQAALDASVAIDAEGKVAGLHFLPAAGGPE